MYINKQTFEVTAFQTENSFQVDDAIADIIRDLNVKGYKTAFCCSGHSKSMYRPEVAYIEFQFGEITPECLPDGWQWVHDGHMECVYKSTNSDDLEKEIKATMREAKRWVKSLPSTR